MIAGGHVGRQAPEDEHQDREVDHQAHGQPERGQGLSYRHCSSLSSSSAGASPSSGRWSGPSGPHPGGTPSGMRTSSGCMYRPLSYTARMHPLPSTLGITTACWLTVSHDTTRALRQRLTISVVFT